MSTRRQGDGDPPAPEEPPRPPFEDVQGYAIYLLDARGRIATWNVGAERISGYPAGEVIGRFHSCFYPQEDILLGKPDQALQVARTKGRFEEEGWRLRRDGSRLFVNVAYTALYHPDGRLRGFSKIVRDITEQRLYEEALRDSNRRLSTTLESISDGYCGVDRDQRFTFVNPAAERLFGKTRADLIGLRVVDAFPFLVGSRFDQDFQRAMANGAMVEFEAPFPPSRSWFEVRAYPSEVGLSIYFRDVTDLRCTRVAQRLLAETGKQLSESLDYGLTIDRVARVAVPELADWCVALIGQMGDRPKHVSVAHKNPREQECARALFARSPPHLNPEIGLGKVLRDGVAEILSELPESFLV